MTGEGRRPHHSTVIAWLALFVALGGVAAGLPGRNTVNSRDIKPDAVRDVDIADDAVGTDAIADGSIATTDIGPGAVGTGQLGPGAVTPEKVGTTPAARVDTPAEAPACGAQSIASSSSEVVQFSQERFDTADLHADPDGSCTAGTQSRLTAPIDGIYQVTASVVWPSNPTNDRQLAILRTTSGGTQSIAVEERPADSGGGTEQSVTTLIDLDSSEYIEARVLQDSGSELSLGTGLETYLAMAWIGPQG